MNDFDGCKTIGDYLGRFLYLISSNGFSVLMDKKLGITEVST